MNKQALQIVQAFSYVDVPEQIIQDSNIKELIRGIHAERDQVKSQSQRLHQLRQEKKEGNFIGNWWDDRDDKIQDAQIDLNKSIGRLTQKSSQLLIINTAISKVLNDQQRILVEQQHILKQQTDALEEQNRKIMEQQKLLERQQQDINQANQGLMEAKGISQEQAQQLVGCVKLVKEAENRISEANHALRLTIEQDLNNSVDRCLERLDSSFAAQEQRYDTFEQQIASRFSTLAQKTQEGLERVVTESAKHTSALEQQLNTALSTQSQHIQTELACFVSDSTKFKVDIEQKLQDHIQTILDKASLQDTVTLQLHETVKVVERKLETVQNEHNQTLKIAEVQLAALQTKQQKIANSNRLAITLVGTLVLLSLGWQVALHFALV